MIDIIRQICIPVGAAAALATLPGTVELLLATSGVALAGWRDRRNAAGQLPANGSLAGFSLAIVVPAHNEEVLIGRCVASLLASARSLERCAVVVIADNCTDSTAARASEAGARVLVRQNAVQRGKGYALRYAFDSLLGEGFDGFLIVDADSIVSENLVPEITRRLAAGAEAVQTRYRVTLPLDSDRKRLMDVALLAFNVLRPLGRYGWGLSCGILGNGFALRRKTLLDVPYSADSIVEDLEYHLLLVDEGKRVDFVDRATVYGDMPSDAGAQESQRARWEGGRFRVALAWIPKLASKVLHGKLSVSEPLLELLTLPVAYLAVLALALCALPIGLFRGYGIGLAALLVAHVAVSVVLGGHARQSLSALATAPAYVFWKLTKMSSVIRSSKRETEWLRTPRESDAKPEVPRV